MKRVFFIVLLVLAAGAHGAPPAANDDIIWQDGERSIPLFVPEGLLQGDLAASPLTRSARSILESRLDYFRTRKLDPGQEICLWNLHTSPGTPSPDAETLPQLIAKSHQFLTVEVVRTVAGWSTWTDIPSTLVWARVSDVLHDETGKLANGALVAFEVGQAQITVDNTPICSTVGAFHLPKAGDRLLVGAASHVIPNERYLAVVRVFPMAGNDILSQPYADLASFAKIPVERAREAADRIRRAEVRQ